MLQVSVLYSFEPPCIPPKEIILPTPSTMDDDNILFHCKFCNHKSKTLAGHLFHSNTHRHLSKFLVCGLGRCKTTHRTESGLRFHIIRNHKFYIAEAKKTFFKKTLFSNVTATFVCPLATCGQNFFYNRDFMKHIKQHLDSGISVPCPASGCRREFKLLKSLTSHVAKKHRNQELIQQSSSSSSSSGLISEAQSHEESSLLLNYDVVVPEDQSLISENIEATPQEDCTVALAQFFQKLEYKHMVSGTVTQVVAKEIKALLLEYQRCFLNNLAINLNTFNILPETICEVLSLMSISSNVLDACHLLRSSYMRKLFFKNHFCFVEPIRIPLENGSFFYYVPIEKTFAAAFQNKSWTFNIKPPEFSKDGFIKDFFDGEAFKTNPFFKQYPEAVPVILYQDGFQVVCPIGPAKNLKHKLLAVYMAFGNLPCEVRFYKDSIQLVALCKECDFNHNEVFGKVVEEFKKLEAGVNVPGCGVVRAGLAFVAGDNLGSHVLGGFVGNFSKAHYFCRYCLLQRKLYYRRGGEVRQFDMRTPESYDSALNKIRNGSSHEGIKFHSLFNELQGFHVCSGLPPCLGHDVLEGVVAFDLKLFIQYFVSKGWFDLEALNCMIETFPYSQEDRKDRPVIIKKLEKKRLAGGAWQLWQTLRLFPLIISNNIEDPNDEVFKLVLQLKDIVEMIVAPEFHELFLPELQCLINDYLICRRELFPGTPLRPKHHFMLHYPELIRKFGCAIKTWTLRFESKHPIFNRSWRTSNNSINILQTLSFKHEFLQSWVRSGGGVRCIVEVGDRTAFVRSMYSETITRSLNSFPPLLDECSSVKIKGTLYKKGAVLILKKLSFGEKLDVGVIHVILVDSSNNVNFLVRKGTASLTLALRAFKLTLTDTFGCVSSTDLVSFYPHSTYIRDTVTYICLRHALVGEP